MNLPNQRQIVSFRRDMEALLKSLKPTIQDDFRTHEEATIPGLAVTIGAHFGPEGIVWDFQTGDNSYSGPAYFYRNWGVVDLHRRDNCRRLAEVIIDQFLTLWAI